MALIANMVLRNEEDRFLEPVLKRLKGIADTIVVTDDASSDNSAYIAARYADSVISLEEPLFTSDEGALRQLSWEHVSNFAKQGDWILAIDADEMLYGEEHLRDYMEHTQKDVLGITFFHMWNDKQFRVDKLWAPVTSSRLFRFYRGGEFAKRKLACGSEPTYVRDAVLRGNFDMHTPFRMKHLGYVRNEDKLAKYERYMELDGGAYHNRIHLESILDPNPTLIDWQDE